MSYKSFDFLKKISFVRTGGSPEELKAANMIMDECKSLGADDVCLEPFLVDGCEIETASLVFTNPDITVECAGVGMSGSTPKEGVTGEFCYVTSLEDAEIQDVAGKICLVHTKLVNVKLYQKLVEKKAAGLILCCGSVYRNNEEVDLDPYMYRERNYKHGKIPAVCIRMRDAETILRSMPKQATLTLIEQEKKNSSHNVVATIKGSVRPNEIICFTAHFDSVSYSNGAYDNATGSTTILQALAHFAKNRPERTMKFIWCGSEEMGLLGSKAYVEAHKAELDNVKICLNVDMTGVTIGADIARCTSEESLVSFIHFLACERGFAISVKQGVYSSDSTPFADAGVPAVSFARIAPSGGAEIHSRRDVLDFLEPKNYYATCDFFNAVADRLDKSKVFPINHSIPKNMVDEIDNYFGRKEK